MALRHEAAEVEEAELRHLELAEAEAAQLQRKVFQEAGRRTAAPARVEQVEVELQLRVVEVQLDLVELPDEEVQVDGQVGEVQLVDAE